MLKDQLEIYVHIPFCVQKCNYCDFLSMPADDSVKEEYVKALLEQISLESDRMKCDMYAARKISSVYFGGGTPSILSVEMLSKIMGAIKKGFPLSADCEITIEVNPGTVDKEKIVALRKMGFNRLSIGMQSANDNELELLGRIHSFEEFKECFINSRLAGFDNINVDVMTGLPSQTIEKLDATLDKVIGLYPEHISTYSLIIEENTPFYEKYGSIEGPVVGEEVERTMYWNTANKLKINGYKHYEISNFSKEGYESRHNCGYWKRIPYLGLGLGASSHVCYSTGEEYRLKNMSDMKAYIYNPDAKEENSKLQYKDMVEEFMFLGLRMLDGISRDEFYQNFGSTVEGFYAPVLDNLNRDGLIMLYEDRIKLSERGVDYGNYVFSKFLIEKE